MTNNQIATLLLADRRDLLVEQSMLYINKQVGKMYKPNRWFEHSDVTALAVELLLTYAAPGTSAYDWWRWCRVMCRRAWSRTTKKLDKWGKEPLLSDIETEGATL